MSEETINEEKQRFPILIDNDEVKRLIGEARALEWMVNHQTNKYTAKMKDIWNILALVHKLDMKMHYYTLASEIPTIYYVRPRLVDQKVDETKAVTL